MKVCVLKIQPKFWEMIKNNQKSMEFRKLNKRFIEKDDVIKFVDLNGNELGYAHVYGTGTVLTDQVQYMLMVDEETNKFIVENYSKEKYIYMIELEPLEVIA